jgi:hypothetical protein
MSGSLEGEVIVLNLVDGTYYSLDPVGARIWELVQTSRKVADVEATLLDEFEVEPERCRGDLVRLLEQLLELGLVEVEVEGVP